jgi:hypothetical protein
LREEHERAVMWSSLMMLSFHVLGEFSKKKNVNIALIKKNSIDKLPSCYPCLMCDSHSWPMLIQVRAIHVWWWYIDPRCIRDLLLLLIKLPLHLSMHGEILSLWCDFFCPNRYVIEFDSKKTYDAILNTIRVQSQD